MDEKRRERREKAAIKKAGNRQRRRDLKRQLERSPEDATSKDEYEIGRSFKSSVLNKERPRRKRAARDEEE
jgi:hypothetical protein